MSLLHDEYEDESGRTVLFRCTECNETYLSLGSLHAHVEGHWSLLGSLRWHLTHWLRDDPSSKWMECTEVLAVDDVESISMSEVEQ